MARMNSQARIRLGYEGLTTRQWAQINGYEGAADWRGDACGCTDDRCIGYHHGASEACQCLPALLVRHATAAAGAGH